MALEVGLWLWSCVHEYADPVVGWCSTRPDPRREAPPALGAQALWWCTPAEMKALPFCEAGPAAPGRAGLGTARVIRRTFQLRAPRRTVAGGTSGRAAW